MNILSFFKVFPDEESCKKHFLEHRKIKGVICKKCDSKDHCWLKSKEQFQCKKCRFRTTLRSGTVLHASKLSYQYWYIAIHLMTATKKGFSAHEMRRQIGHKRYEPIWALMKKLRISMGASNDKVMLQGFVELDDAYLSTYTASKDKRELKRGKGSQKKSKVTVMAESIPLEENNKTNSFKGNVKMKFNPSEKKSSINHIAQENINLDSVIVTDKSTSYVDLDKFFNQNIQYKSMLEGNDMDFNWLNIAIANTKRFLLGIYHVVKEKYLQQYLDEFCFNLNKRFHPNLFENLVFNVV